MAPRHGREAGSRAPVSASMRARDLTCLAAALCALGCNTLDSQTDPDHSSVPPRRAPPEPAHVETSDKVDLLFVVDDSNTMVREQSALRRELPRLIAALATGDADGDGTPEHAPVSDLHLGVVSSDMGVVGVAGVANCQGFGDDGLLQHQPSLAVEGCAPAYPTFLSFSAGRDEVDSTAHDFACIASLGTGGCGFEQPLEAALKALWPSQDTFPNDDGSNRVSFLQDANGFGMVGHGDSENMGFLRNDPTRGLSIIAIVLISDEDDCSARDTRLFTPNTLLDPSDSVNAELLQQGLNVRCPLNPERLYEPERYVKGLRALRRNSEQLVVFAAIVGVPPETVGPEALAAADLADADSREQFYATIREHPQMQPTIDDHGTADPADDVLEPSCETDNGRAFPPLRLLDVAEGFAENGLVQSICADDFAPAIDALAALIGRHLPQ
jgi:hypothetical protein